LYNPTTTYIERLGLMSFEPNMPTVDHDDYDDIWINKFGIHSQISTKVLEMLGSTI